jgi:hypothetical protein
MGVFKNAKNAIQAAQMPGGMPMPGGMQMPGVAAGMKLPGDMAYAAMVNKIGQSGVEASAEIKAMRPTSDPGMSGEVEHEIDVTITPTGGQPYDTMIRQSLMPNAVNSLSVGKAITVRYDPDKPTDAVLHSW